MPAVLLQLRCARLSLGQLFQKRDNLPEFPADEANASRARRILIQLAVMAVNQLVDENHFFRYPFALGYTFKNSSKKGRVPPGESCLP